MYPARETVHVNAEGLSVKDTDRTVNFSRHEFPEVAGHVVFCCDDSFRFVEELARQNTNWHIDAFRIVSIDELL